MTGITNITEVTNITGVKNVTLSSLKKARLGLCKSALSFIIIARRVNNIKDNNFKAIIAG